MKLRRAHLTFVPFALLAALSLLAACAGGGNSTSVPHPAASAGNTAAGSAGANGKQRIGLKLILGSATASRTQSARTRAARSKAAKALGQRRPQYINEDDTDSLYITELDGSGNIVNGPTGFDVSIDTGTLAYPSIGPVGQQACWYLAASGTLRECEMLFSATPGTETFFVSAVCENETILSGKGANGDCTIQNGFSPPVYLAVGATTTTILQGQTNTFTVTMQPVLSPNPNTIFLSSVGPPATITSGIGGCIANSACSLYSFDSDASSTLGPLYFTPFDGSGAVIPYSMPDPFAADYGGQSTPTPEPNLDPFGQLPQPTPTASISTDTISPQVSEFYYTGYPGGTAPGHVFMAGSSCSGFASFQLDDAYDLILNIAAPYLCYDGAAPFNGDNPQYYTSLTAINSSSLSLGAIIAAPIFVELSSTPMVDCGSSSDACIQYGEFGYFGPTDGSRSYGSGDFVAATISSGSCPSDWSLIAFQYGSNTSGGTNTYDGSFGNLQTGVNTGGGTATAYSMFDDNGYAQFRLTPGASGETCTVSFQANANLASAGTTVTRTYQSNGTTITIFGQKRRVR